MRFMQFLAVAALAGGWATILSGCSRPTAEATEAAQSPAAAALNRVTAGTPQRKTLTLYTSQPGRIEAFAQTPLFPKLAGFVQSVLVDIGDRVETGQVLIELAIPELHDEREQKEALVAQAAAEVIQAEAALEAARAAEVTAGARVRQAEAGIGRAEGEYDRWKSEYERIKELAAQGSVTTKLVDETLNQFRSAEAARHESEANVESAKAALNGARANIVKAQADLSTAQARQRVAEADLTKTRTMLGYAQIKAPFDGVVTQRGVDTGHYVHPANGSASRPLLVVARTDQVRIFVDVPEMEAPLVDAAETGDAATVRVQSLGGRQFEGKVTRTSWALDRANRSLRTEIDIPNEDGLLRPGMYATVTILLEQRDEALALPITAIIHNGEETYCCAVESGRIEHRPITLGLRSGDEVEVVSGLDDNDIVVLARTDALQHGQPVEVIEPEE